VPAASASSHWPALPCLIDRVDFQVDMETTRTAATKRGEPPVGATWLFHRRVALGIDEHAAPSMVFVGIGILLGPRLLNFVSMDVLAQFDPVISIALAVLGIFVGFGYVSARGAEKRKWVVGATFQAFVTVASVSTAMYFLLSGWKLPLPVDSFTAAIVLGICTAASAAMRVDAAGSQHLLTAADLADFDDLAVIALATVVVPLLAGGLSIALAVALALVVGLSIGAAGSLLFTRSQGTPERGVFVTGTVVLLGGAAAYASLSPLATGCIAGLLWARSQKSTASLVESELRKLQHPLVALLLIVAGASIQFSYSLLWLAAPLVLFRFTGKLLGSVVLGRC
jgi:hypothetical protein